MREKDQIEDKKKTKKKKENVEETKITKDKEDNSEEEKETKEVKDENEEKNRKIIKKECEICHIFVKAYLYRAHHMNHPSQILKFLYLGNYKHSSNNNELKRLKINYHIYIP